MKRDRAITLGVLLLAAVALLLWEVLAPPFADPVRAQLWDTVVARFLGVVVALALIRFCRLRVFALARCAWALLPCAAAVCLNNAPWLALFRGEATLLRTELMSLFLLSSLLVGAFEELFFRGVLLPLWLERLPRTRRALFVGVIGSSAVFALLHLLNLLGGASVGATLLQVGYSFLVGAMCAVVLLACGSVLPCILLHAVYDACGLLVPTLGQGRIWNTPTVVWTALLGVGVTALFAVSLWRMPPAYKDSFFQTEEMK